ncbi:MAG: c-type cytochrome [Rhodothalassiaceae bacterium]
MDSFEWTKIFGAILSALLLSQLFSWAAEEALHPHYPDQTAYEIAVPEDDTAAAEDEAPAGPTFAELMVQATADAGQRVFRKCQACHSIEQGGAHGQGPNLYDIVGAPIAGKDGYNYSSALQGLDGDWTYERLNEWLINPQAVASGSKMVYQLGKADDRADVIVYLAEQSENPPPLPSAETGGE